MKLSIQVAGLTVLAAMHMQAARDSRPADVTVYVGGARFPPGLVDYGARRSVTRMYARIGVRIEWRIVSVASSAAPGSPVVIQMRYAGENETHSSPESFGFARPFADGANAITVMYDRVQIATEKPARQEAILAHVLAHEIGHVLQRNNQHAQTGVMKAHWNGQDYAAMEKKPLDFTPDDVDQIARGLTARKAQTAGGTAAWQ